jgi:hypothetical protein
VVKLVNSKPALVIHCVLRIPKFIAPCASMGSVLRRVCRQGAQ